MRQADAIELDRTVPRRAGGLDAFNALVVHPTRLQILLDLHATDASGTAFMGLRRRIGLTDGNLACHARKLADGGLIHIDKAFHSGKPLTTLTISSAGRAALSAHLMALTQALTSPLSTNPPVSELIGSMPLSSDRSSPPGAMVEAQPVVGVSEVDHSEEEADDWID